MYVCAHTPTPLSTCRGQRKTLGASTLLLPTLGASALLLPTLGASTLLLPWVQGQVIGPGGPTIQLSHLASSEIKFSLKNNLVGFISSFMNDLFIRLLRGWGRSSTVTSKHWNLQVGGLIILTWAVSGWSLIPCCFITTTTFYIIWIR